MIYPSGIEFLDPWPGLDNPNLPPYPAFYTGLFELWSNTTLIPKIPTIPKFFFDGVLLEGAYDGFYNRIHYIGSLDAAFGLVAVDTSQSIQIWSAYPTNTTLTATGEELDGTELSGVTIPTSLLPMQEFTLELTALVDGPPISIGFYNLAFSNAAEGETTNLIWKFSAQRVLTRKLPIDWAQPVQETYEYITSVLDSDDGTEQRIALRKNPRSTYTVYMTPRHDETFTLRNMLAKQDKVYAIPYFPDVRYVALDAPAGTDVVELTEAIPYLTAGDTLIFEAGGTWVPSAVQGIAGTQVTLSSPLTVALKPNNKVWRAIFCRLPATVGNNFLSGNVNSLSIEYLVLDEFSPLRRGEVSSYEEYQNLPIMDLGINWRDNLQFTHVFDRFELDLGYENRAFYYSDPVGYLVKANNYTLLDRFEIDKLIDFYNNRLGQLKPFWISSGVEDLKMIGVIPATVAGETSFVVSGAGVFENFNDGLIHSAVEIRLKSGVVYRGLVSAINESAGDTSLVALNSVDPAIPDEILGSAISRISWLYLSRFDIDTLTVERLTSTIAETTLTTRTLRGTEL